MIEYELAKQLKDAGFPQRSYLGAVSYYGKDPAVQIEREADQTGVYAPTLSELIEACDDETFTLIHDKDGWYAENTPGMSHSKCKSPEEAVARLWLDMYADGDATA